MHVGGGNKLSKTTLHVFVKEYLFNMGEEEKNKNLVFYKNLSQKFAQKNNIHLTLKEHKFNIKLDHIFSPRNITNTSDFYL